MRTERVRQTHSRTSWVSVQAHFYANYDASNLKSGMETANSSEIFSQRKKITQKTFQPAAGSLI